jgi:hypothetical protein
MVGSAIAEAAADALARWLASGPLDFVPLSFGPGAARFSADLDGDGHVVLDVDLETDGPSPLDLFRTFTGATSRSFAAVELWRQTPIMDDRLTIRLGGQDGAVGVPPKGMELEAIYDAMTAAARRSPGQPFWFDGASLESGPGPRPAAPPPGPRG